MTAIAGVFFAFYYNNLFPEQVFNIARSIEIILGPIIGGVGTLFGPILGAFVLTGLAEAMSGTLARGRLDVPGQASVLRPGAAGGRHRSCPHGIWPWLARGSSACEERDHERAA